MNGVFFAVVGPSGAGKDTLIDYARNALREDPGFAFPKRVITRPADAGGEDHVAVSTDAFKTMAAAGAFLLHWNAHGLRYGVPAKTAELIGAGTSIVVNLSRAAIDQLTRKVPHVEVIHVTAPLETIAKRLAERDRESADDIAERLKRASYELPDVAPVTTIVNDRTIEEAGDELVRVLKRLAGREAYG